MPQVMLILTSLHLAATWQLWSLNSLERGGGGGGGGFGVRGNRVAPLVLSYHPNDCKAKGSLGPNPKIPHGVLQ